LTLYRLHHFGLTEFVDFFVSSCFVHYRKPDADIYRIALDIGQIEPDAIVYVDDRPLFVDIANSLGMHGLHHKDYATTKQAMAGWGLPV
jgi:putative hydrolase of the HAD superfamily